MSDHHDRRRIRRLKEEGTVESLDGAVSVLRRSLPLVDAQRDVYGIGAHDVATALLPSGKGKVHLVRPHRGGHADGAVLWSACGLTFGILSDPATRARIEWGSHLPFRARTEEGDAQRRIWANAQFALGEPRGELDDDSACKTCAWVLMGKIGGSNEHDDDWHHGRLGAWQGQVAASIGVVPFTCRRHEHLGDPCAYCRHATAPLFGLA